MVAGISISSICIFMSNMQIEAIEASVAIRHAKNFLNMGKSPSVPEKFIIKEEKIMANKTLWSIIMETLIAEGIITDSKLAEEAAKKYRIAMNIRKTNIDEMLPQIIEKAKAEFSVIANDEEENGLNEQNWNAVDGHEEVFNGEDVTEASVMDSIMPVGPLAQNPLANVTTKPNDVVPAAVKEEAKKLEIVGTTWGELAEKFPDGKIPGFNLSLACTAELRHRKDEARMKDPNCEFWKLRALSREEIYDMLWRRGAEYNWLRDAALGKTQENKKPNIDRNWKDVYEKFDIVLRDHQLRIWVDKNKPEPEGMVYVNDQADHPFLRFRWGFKRDGMSFPLPNVKRKVPGANKYESVENFEDVAEAIKKVLVSKGYIPKRSPGTVKPGITMQNWGCRVI